MWLRTREDIEGMQVTGCDENAHSISLWGDKPRHGVNNGHELKRERGCLGEHYAEDIWVSELAHSLSREMKDAV